jgi:hypothetical protein
MERAFAFLQQCPDMMMSVADRCEHCNFLFLSINLFWGTTLCDACYFNPQVIIKIMSDIESNLRTKAKQIQEQNEFLLDPSASASTGNTDHFYTEMTNSLVFSDPPETPSTVLEPPGSPSLLSSPYITDVSNSSDDDDDDTEEDNGFSYLDQLRSIEEEENSTPFIPPLTPTTLTEYCTMDSEFDLFTPPPL